MYLLTITSVFLSTPSARRATSGFNTFLRAICISIHALREEGDLCRGVHTASSTTFLSTPSARRATSACLALVGSAPISIHALREEGDLIQIDWDEVARVISIHALREEGDVLPNLVMVDEAGFLSTPSARRATGQHSGAKCYHNISIHALREEGDREFIRVDFSMDGFLSTPSARRATAKTETKSLFSNKLYNILHEFRRALIYNGSKNDPNHAK